MIHKEQRGISQSKSVEFIQVFVWRVVQIVGQMETLYSAMRLSTSDVERRASVCQYLHNLLVPYLPSKYPDIIK